MLLQVNVFYYYILEADKRGVFVIPEGLEPSTNTLRGYCSTIELWDLIVIVPQRSALHAGCYGTELARPQGSDL